MIKKNKLPIKWMLGILIFLMAVSFGTYQLSKNIAMSTMSSNASSSPQYNFLQFLLSLIGIHIPGTSSGEASKENMMADQNNPNARQIGGLNTANQQGLASDNNASATQGSNAAKLKNNNEINAEINAENNPEYSSVINVESNSEINATFNEETNTEFNAEYNPGINPAGNSETNADQGPGNSEINAENNSENNNPVNNAGTNNNQGPGNSNSGSNSGSNSNDNSGNNGWNGNQSNLPTINPIPSDDQVLQNVTQQNQQNDALAKLMATRQALVVPVQQQAQASKYQTVASPSIPTPSTNQPPADVVAKVQAKQLTLH